MRIVICWSDISGYMAACWRALAQMPGVELFVLAYQIGAGEQNIAFSGQLLQGLDYRLLNREEAQDESAVAKLAVEQRPDVVVFSGWLNPAYRALPSNEKLRAAKFVMCMDTPRRDTLRQRLGRFRIAGLMRSIHRVMVPGERAWQLARLLNVPECKIRRGLYGVDYDGLAPLYERRIAQPGGWPKKFLYIGRYAEEKAIDVLADAYRRYRALSKTDEPWPLTCCGSGPLAVLLKGQPGVQDLGFQQPDEIHRLLMEHGVFVLASRFDPWPLVLTESAAAGVPAVYTEACGSSVEVARDGFTGRAVATDDPDAFASAMKWCHDHYDDLAMMGQRAQPLAQAYSAHAWAMRWHMMCAEMLAQG